MPKVSFCKIISIFAENIKQKDIKSWQNEFLF